MKYDVNKENFRDLLRHRPALLSKIVTLDEDTAAFIVEKVKRCYERLPYELKASVKVVLAFLVHEKDRFYGIDINLIPTEALEKLDQKTRNFLIAKQSGRSTYSTVGDLATRFSGLSFAEWKVAVRNGYSIHNVPEEHHGKKTLWGAYARFLVDDHSEGSEIPEKFWEADPDQANLDIIELIQTVTWKALMITPPKFITREMLRATFTQRPENCNLDDEKYLEIPTKSWTRDIAELALKTNAHNIKAIPESLLTEDDAIYCADQKINDIPEKYRTRTVKVHEVAASLYPYTEVESTGFIRRTGSDPLFHDLSFQIDVIKLGEAQGVKNIQEFIKVKDRETILKEHPQFLKYIPKLEQTDSIIQTFLDNATTEDIEAVDTEINLSKIKKRHAPLLIGVDSKLIMSTIEKKLRSQRKKKVKPAVVEEAPAVEEEAPAKVQSGTIEIDIAPAEFSRIQTDLERDRN